MGSSYDADLDLLFKATKKTIAESQYSHFQECFEGLKLKPYPLQDTRKKKIVKFALILHLRLLAKEDFPEEISQKAEKQLLSLGELDGEDDWIEDPDIFEALVEALHSIYQRHEEKVFSLMQRLDITLRQSTFQRLQKKFDEWKGHRTVAEKLKKNFKNKIAPSNQLFLKTMTSSDISTTRSEIGFLMEGLKRPRPESEVATVSIMKIFPAKSFPVGSTNSDTDWRRNCT